MRRLFRKPLGFGPRRNERVLIEISLIRELDDVGAVLQGELFRVCKYVQRVPRNVKQRLWGKGWLAGRKRLAGQRQLIIAIEITGGNRKYT